MRSYRDFCRPANPVERTDKAPGDREIVLGRVLPVEGATTVVPMRKRAGR